MERRKNSDKGKEIADTSNPKDVTSIFKDNNPPIKEIAKLKEVSKNLDEQLSILENSYRTLIKEETKDTRQHQALPLFRDYHTLHGEYTSECTKVLEMTHKLGSDGYEQVYDEKVTASVEKLKRKYIKQERPTLQASGDCNEILYPKSTSLLSLLELDRRHCKLQAIFLDVALKECEHIASK